MLRLKSLKSWFKSSCPEQRVPRGAAVPVTVVIVGTQVPHEVLLTKSIVKIISSNILVTVVLLTGTI